MTAKIHSSRMSSKQRARLHPDFLKNEAAYWKNRAKLLMNYSGKWIAFDQSAGVIATGETVLDIGIQLQQLDTHPYVVWVGKEEEFVVCMRSTFSYNTKYSPTALPTATITFHNGDRSRSLTDSNVIPDTGADLSSLIEDDAQTLILDQTPSIPIQTRGVTGPPVATALYPGFASIDKSDYPCFFQILPGNERILGRDVLNQIRVIFDGPNQQVIFDTPDKQT